MLTALVRIWLWPQQCFPALLCLAALKAIFQGKAWKPHPIKAPSYLLLCFSSGSFLWIWPLGSGQKKNLPFLPLSASVLFLVFPSGWSESFLSCHGHILHAVNKCCKGGTMLPMCHFTSVMFSQGPRIWSTNTRVDYSYRLILNIRITPICFRWSWIHLAESEQILYNEQLPNSLSCTLPPSSVYPPPLPPSPHPRLPTHCCRELTQW